jgi:uncharacterized protein YdcH (DUF465 family)
MIEKDQDQTFSMLRKIFPEYENRLEQIYLQDSVFREIAAEIRECTEKQEMIYQKTGKRSCSYTDTIEELKDELLAFLDNQKSSNHTIDNY